MDVMDVMDVIDALLGDPALTALRQARPDFVRYSQGSYDVLITPGDPGGLSHGERAAAAHRVARLNADTRLAAHYASLLDDAPETGRRAAILAHVARVATAPREATPAHLQALRDAGLSPQDIVALSQLIAFVSYQTRVVSGLRLLAAEASA